MNPIIRRLSIYCTFLIAVLSVYWVEYLINYVWYDGVFKADLQICFLCNLLIILNWCQLNIIFQYMRDLILNY